ncbi:MAG: hypothetical protein HY000_14815 [Planctomycetes bacterium]|nr:hypothetical protein [Planctomycetota bacterium]
MKRNLTRCVGLVVVLTLGTIASSQQPERGARVPGKTVGDAAAKTADARRMMLWVEGASGDANHLTSQISINGKTIGLFKAQAKQYLDADLKTGWNDITVKTTPTKPTGDCRGLWFTIGSVREDKASGEQVMDHALFSFNSHNGWRFEDGKFMHDFGPKTQDVTLSFRLYFAGLEHEDQIAEEGDYVLQSDLNSSENDAATATVFVNGTPLNTFFNTERQMVITPLLKPGRNEIRLVTGRVKNSSYGDYQEFQLLGPMVYNALKKTLVGGQVIQFRSMIGWQRVEATQRLVYQEQPGEKSSEEVFAFMLDQAPLSSGAEPAVGADARHLMLRVETGSGDRNHLTSDISINGKDIGRFNTQTKQNLDADLAPGWNDITIKTAPTKPTVDCRGLWFTIGSVYEDRDLGKLVMERPLWTFNNRNGWRYEDGKFMHDFGPKTREVAISFRVFFAGLKNERTAKPEEADYVLQSDSNSGEKDAVTATVYVNGTPLNTFFNTERQIIITPLLKQGRNEIRLVSGRVKNGTYGGQRVEQTQQLVYQQQPAAESSEEQFTFILEKAP